eukprot:jgi/Botrbrau1/22997/Bobra.0030s0061.1
MCLKSRQSSRTVAGEARTYDLSACLQVMPNAHNLTNSQWPFGHKYDDRDI